MSRRLRREAILLRPLSRPRGAVSQSVAPSSVPQHGVGHNSNYDMVGIASQYQRAGVSLDSIGVPDYIRQSAPHTIRVDGVIGRADSEVRPVSGNYTIGADYARAADVVGQHVSDTLGRQGFARRLVQAQPAYGDAVIHRPPASRAPDQMSFESRRHELQRSIDEHLAEYNGLPNTPETVARISHAVSEQVAEMVAAGMLSRTHVNNAMFGAIYGS